MIEVEVRGKIDGNFEKFLEKFRKKAKFVEEKDRFSLIYARKFVRDVAEIKDDPIDFKLRITNKKAEIVLKYGLWGGREDRKEILIPIETEKFNEAVELFNLLGWNKGFTMATKTYVFDYNGVEFALVKSKEISYFEAEVLVDKSSLVEKAHEKIEMFCKELGLEIFSDQELIDLLNKINNSEGRTFDLSKESFSEIKVKYKNYF